MPLKIKSKIDKNNLCEKRPRFIPVVAGQYCTEFSKL